MNARRVEVTFSREDWARLEKARGHEPRASFVRRALESALGGAEEPVHEVSGRAASAPARAPAVLVREAGARMAESVGVKSARDVLNLQRQERLNKGSVSRKGKK